MTPIPSQAVVDTGPLFDVLGLNYAQELVEPKLANCLQRLSGAGQNFVERQALRDGYLQFFSKMRTLLTTAHVVGELQGLVKSRLKIDARDDEHRFFWARSIRFLRQRNIDECLLRVIDLPDETVGRLGPADASVIDLARQRGCTVLTNEGNLKSLAIAQGIPCYLMRELVW